MKPPLAHKMMLRQVQSYLKIMNENKLKIKDVLRMLGGLTKTLEILRIFNESYVEDP